METSNKNEANKALVLEKLGAVRVALNAEPPGPPVAQALAQCDRLQLAISQFHAEGLRFAAFTLFRLTLPPSATLSLSVQTAARSLKAALDSAGYPH